MGFGLLFIGYFFFTYVLPLQLQFLSIAAAIIFFALKRLSVYHDDFRRAMYLTPLLILAGAPDILRMLLPVGFAAPFENTVLLYICSLVAWMTLFFFHFLLFTAIAELAKGAGILRLRVAAVRNRLFTCIFCAIRFSLQCLESTVPVKVYAYLLIGIIIFGLLISILNMFMLYGAYRQFCPVGQERAGITEYQRFIDSNMEKLKSKKGGKRDE